MDILLTQEEIRVLGCLMEKEMATPEYYPLSLNALTNACNQKSNRDPVTSYTEEAVSAALEGLRQKKCAMESSGSRVQRYAQTFSRLYNLKRSEEAVMCILFVRGPQTPGEIRSRTERLYPFTALEEVQETISNLERVELVKILPRQPGRKECRYAHLLEGDPVVQFEGHNQALSNPERMQESNVEQINLFKDEIAMLREELLDLKQEFEQFKAQFS
ncbi:MAG: YceH family protein [Deltaproteobacteria bacterium]|nr:YceH family protein [Deltaproteobacteria bacterium]